MRRIAHFFRQQQTFDRVMSILVFRHRPARESVAVMELTNHVVCSYWCSSIVLRVNEIEGIAERSDR
jgi:hypothetical protein